MLKRLNHQQKDGVPFFSKLEHLDSTLPRPTDLVTYPLPKELLINHPTEKDLLLNNLMATKIQFFSILVYCFYFFFHCACCKRCYIS